VQIVDNLPICGWVDDDELRSLRNEIHVLNSLLAVSLAEREVLASENSSLQKGVIDLERSLGESQELLEGARRAGAPAAKTRLDREQWIDDKCCESGRI
jgi:hypothetical protein